MKVFYKILGSIFVVLLLVMLGTYLYLNATTPSYEGIEQIEGLEDQVDIYYDNYGIPHIYAENRDDAYFALGYAHAKDRLFQMEIIRRLVSGKMSEILGPDLIETDKHLLTLGLREAAVRSAEKYMSQNTEAYQKAANAYLKGINYYQDHGITPIEFKILGIEKAAFTSVDIYTTMGYLSLGFAAAINEEPYTSYIKEKLGYEYIKDWPVNTKIQTTDALKDLDNVFNQSEPQDLSLVSIKKVLGDLSIPMWTGSNGWVIGPEHSKSNKVLLANDTHIAFSQPSVWFEAHIEYPGFSFYGNHLATVPFGVLGHTRDLGWGVTIFPIDNLDLYREKVNPNNPFEVWENDRWVKMKVRNETIKVKGEEDISFDINYSRHGAIINEITNKLEKNEAPIALWWEAVRGETKALQAIYKMNISKNISDFEDAIKDIDIIGLNILYGDTKDNIAWWGVGKMPKHKASTHSKFILDGASGNEEILGYYDFSENPSIINPASGLIISANHEPDSSYGNGIVYPGYYLPDSRFERLTEILNTKEKWSQEEFKAIQTDVTSNFDARNTRIMYNEISENEKLMDDFSLEILQILKEWNGSYDKNEKGPMVYQKLIYHVMDYCVSDELPEGVYKELLSTHSFKKTIPEMVANNKAIWWDDVNTRRVKESRADIMVKAFHKTVEELKSQYGTNLDSWKWSDVHQLTHVHPIGRKKPFDRLFNVGPFPVPGGNGAPNNLMYINNNEGHYDVTGGAAVRLIIDFNDIEASESINPTGQSGNVMSPHYGDQGKMFAEGKYRKQLMNKEEILANSTKFSLVKK